MTNRWTIRQTDATNYGTATASGTRSASFARRRNRVGQATSRAITQRAANARAMEVIASILIWTG